MPDAKKVLTLEELIEKARAFAEEAGKSSRGLAYVADLVRILASRILDRDREAEANAAKVVELAGKVDVFQRKIGELRGFLESLIKEAKRAAEASGEGQGEGGEGQGEGEGGEVLEGQGEGGEGQGEGEGGANAAGAAARRLMRQRATAEGGGAAAEGESAGPNFAEAAARALMAGRPGSGARPRPAAKPAPARPAPAKPAPPQPAPTVPASGAAAEEARAIAAADAALHGSNGGAS